MFARDGYAGTSTASVAEAAGLPKGLLFHYFPTKADLLAAVVTERSPLRALASLPVRPVPGDVAATLSTLARQFRRRVSPRPGSERIVFREASVHHRVRQVLADLHEQAVAHVRDSVASALPGGSVGERPLQAAATTFASAMLHDLQLRQATGVGLDLDGVAGLVAAALEAQPTEE